MATDNLEEVEAAELTYRHCVYQVPPNFGIPASASLVPFLPSLSQTTRVWAFCFKLALEK